MFLIIGNGAEKEYLLKLKNSINANNVMILPSVSKNDIAKYISIYDVALVNLKKSETFKI